MKTSVIIARIIYFSLMFSSLVFAALSAGFVISINIGSSPSLLNNNHFKMSYHDTSDLNPVDKLIYNFTDHTSEVWDVEFSPTDSILASASVDSNIMLWNISTGVLINSLQDHTQAVYSIAFHPSGELLASGSYDQTILIWNITSGEPIQNLTGHTGPIWSLRFSPEGNILASGSDDKTIILWNTTTWSSITSLVGHTDRIKTLKFSPDGEYLVSGSYDDSLKIWNITSFTSISTLAEHIGNVIDVEFSSDGNYIISGSHDQTVKYWDSSTYNLVQNNVYNTWIRSIAISSDGFTQCVGLLDHQISFWTHTNNTIGHMSAHSLSILDMDFDRTGSILASSSDDSTICIWNLSDLDSDDMPTVWELQFGLDPGSNIDRLSDLDLDDLSNYLEYSYGTDPTDYDTDDDLMRDGYEFIYGLNGIVNDAALDLDGDMIPNLYEYNNNLSVAENDADEDSDRDGMPNLYEYLYGLLAGTDDDAYTDLDNDGMPNLYEYENSLTPNINDASEDPDKDGLTNLQEYKFGSNPQFADSDLDGWNDNLEYFFGTNPRSSLSNPLTSSILIIFGVLILISGVFAGIRVTPKIKQELRSFKQQQKMESWFRDFSQGKALPIDYLTTLLGVPSLEVPNVIKRKSSIYGNITRFLIMRSQMLLLKPHPIVSCQICMSEVANTHYLQCTKCKRYVCLDDYVDLRSVGRSTCPNCSSSLMVFPFSCSACELDFISVDEITHETRCPLCGYSLPEQSKLLETFTKKLEPSKITHKINRVNELFDNETKNRKK